MRHLPTMEGLRAVGRYLTGKRQERLRSQACYSALFEVERHTEPVTLTQVGSAQGLGPDACRRALNDLMAAGVVVRTKGAVAGYQRKPIGTVEPHADMVLDAIRVYGALDPADVADHLGIGLDAAVLAVMALEEGGHVSPFDGRWWPLNWKQSAVYQATATKLYAMFRAKGVEDPDRTHRMIRALRLAVVLDEAVKAGLIPSTSEVAAGSALKKLQRAAGIATPAQFKQACADFKAAAHHGRDRKASPKRTK